jgi:hypothetical protein
MSQPRYVVLYHEMPGANDRESHWDLMFEVGDVLATFALGRPPGESAEQIAEVLPDHRREYLDYEGPISGGRGSVSRWDEGIYEAIRHTDDTWEIRMTGARIAGIAVISNVSDSPQKRSISWRLDEPGG